MCVHMYTYFCTYPYIQRETCICIHVSLHTHIPVLCVKVDVVVDVGVRAGEVYMYLHMLK